MSRPLLNLDGGELDDEPEELYALADVVHVACGGHTGDERSITRVVDACVRLGTRVGAHPSYVDRQGFGRIAQDVSPEQLARQVESQCASLRAIAEACATTVTSVKPHGALYHAAHAKREIARACVEGIERALGRVAVVGLTGGALEAEARQRGHPFLREGFADRAVRADGSLVPRGEPGALIEDPAAAAEQARSLRDSGMTETICVHADTPSALAIVRAVRHVLDT